MATKNYGFVPHKANGEQPKDQSSEPKNVENTSDEDELEVLKAKINRLLIRHPKLVPRSSIRVLQRFEGLDREELENILFNAINDANELNGTPVASCILSTFGRLIESLGVEGFVDECMQDDELKKDIESEISEIIGLMGTRMNICFRLLSNVSNASHKNKRKKVIEEEKASEFKQNAEEQPEADRESKRQKINDEIELQEEQQGEAIRID